jgi:hypothetical protein
VSRRAERSVNVRRRVERVIAEGVAFELWRRQRAAELALEAQARLEAETVQRLRVGSWGA